MMETLYYVTLLLALPPTVIYLFTYCRSLQQASRTGCPITPPYTIPQASHLASILFNTECFLRYLQSRFHGSLVSLSSAVPLYYVLPGIEIRTLFASSRDLVPAPSLFDALKVFFGLKEIDFDVFTHEKISAFESLEGFHTKHRDPSRRIMEHQRKDFATYLSGDNLKRVMLRYSINFQQSMWPQESDIHGSVCLPDIYVYLRNLIFQAEVEALYGKQIFDICPSFCADFWAFYDAFPIVSRRFPTWLFPSHYGTRDKMKRNFHAWRASYALASRPKDENEIPYGTLYIRDMVKRHENLGLSDDGIASVLLGYLFVTIANTVPAAAWMILNILLDGTLTQRIRHELSIYQGQQSRPDLSALGSAPLLNSVYREVLRLYVAGTIGRKSLNGAFCLRNGCEILPGIPAMSASWLGGLDSSFWNVGKSSDGVPEHPVECFWAERFLEYPGDPASGPCKNTTGSIPETTNKPKTPQDDSKAKLITSGLRSHWFPFGGGAWKCPGEMLAKSTILVSVFLILNHLEIEIIDPAAASVLTPSHRTLPFGSHAFSRAVPIRLRARTVKASGL